VPADSPVTSGGYDITIPPAESVWKSFDFNAAPNFAAGSHSTNESADALNISGRGKVESQQQVFHYVYTQITGDRNPLHYDEQAARNSLFKGLIVQGGITSGMLNAIVAEDLPGPGTVFLAMELKFVKAVYVGDTITGRVEVMSARRDKPICTVAVSVRNQDGEVCLNGTATTYTAPLRLSEAS